MASAASARPVGARRRPVRKRRLRGKTKRPRRSLHGPATAMRPQLSRARANPPPFHPPPRVPCRRRPSRRRKYRRHHHGTATKATQSRCSTRWRTMRPRPTARRGAGPVRPAHAAAGTTTMAACATVAVVAAAAAAVIGTRGMTSDGAGTCVRSWTTAGGAAAGTGAATTRATATVRRRVYTRAVALWYAICAVALMLMLLVLLGVYTNDGRPSRSGTGRRRTCDTVPTTEGGTRLYVEIQQWLAMVH
jgi:hypothetical protein